MKFSHSFGGLGYSVLVWKIEGDLPVLGENLEKLRTAAPRTVEIRSAASDFWRGRSNFHGYSKKDPGR